MRVLVTGGSGFIGGHVAEQLIRQGHDVTLLVRRAPIEPPRRARWERGDVTQPESLHAAFHRQDVVVHAAGLSVGEDSWVAHHDLHVRGTHHVLRAALAAGAKRFVHVSSLIVQAIPSDGVLREDGPLRRAIPRWNHYARTKLVAERLVRRFAARLPAVILRPGLVLGPRDRQTTPRILDALRLPLVIGRGGNRIPCVVVEDLATAVAAAVSLPVRRLGTYDLAGAIPITQRELIALHAAAAGLPAPRARCPVFLARALLALRRRFASAASRATSHRLVLEIATADCTVDLTRAAADLGWRGDASYADAVARAVAWERRAPGGSRRPGRAGAVQSPLAAAPEAP